MLSSGQILERYTVEAEIGAGGLATVYRVRHNTLGSAHALKVLHVAGAAMFERLVLEGRVQAALRHPNIVSVTDVIDVSGAPGLVMEHVDGPSLDAWLRQHRPSLAEAERLFLGILAGVAHAHRQGLIHRDLKPGNVLLQQVDGLLVPKVSDFGLVKILAGEERGAAHTRSNVGMGTPSYMSPEQMQDAKRVDARTDVFALGCILYELVCGRRAFDGPSLLSIFNAAATGAYPPLDEVAPGLPPRVVDAITGALHPERDARFPDCDALRRALVGAVSAPEVGRARPAGGSVAELGAGVAGPIASRAPTYQPIADASTDDLAGAAPNAGATPATFAPGAPVAAVAPIADSALSLATQTTPPRVTSPATLPARVGAGAPAARWALAGAAGGLLLAGGMGAVVLLAWLAFRAFGPPDPEVTPLAAAEAPAVPPTEDEPAGEGIAAGAPAASGEAADPAPPDDAAPRARTPRSAERASASSAPSAAPVTTSAAAAPGDVPADLTTGTEDAREEALARYESAPAMTDAIVWVLQNDPAPAVRFKAWRVVRARWRRGTGSAAAHERATAWLAEHGTSKERVEAVVAIREYSRSLPTAAARLGDPDSRVRIAAVGAVLEVARRAGDTPEGRRLLQARLAVETDGDVKEKLEEGIGGL